MVRAPVLGAALLGAWALMTLLVALALAPVQTYVELRTCAGCYGR